MTAIDTDVAVIGAGTAGIVAERKARSAGARTVLIDPAFAGTTCATVGCMPSKLLIAAGKAAHGALRAPLFGIQTDDIDIDTADVMQRLHGERRRFVEGVKAGFDALPDGTALRARARFQGPTELLLDDGRRVSARAVVIATGASPRVPGPFAALGDLILTNETLFDLDRLPASVGVIGAGPLGIEIAQALHRLGVRVAVHDKGERLAQIEDDEINAAFLVAMRREFAVHTGVDMRAERAGGGVAVIRENGASEVFDRLLVAAGRSPNVQDLGLDAAGLVTGEDGLPRFDPQTLQCGDTPVFIAGDANGSRPVLHEAAAEGATAGMNAASYPVVKPSSRMTRLNIVFTDPNVAMVGHQPGEHAGKTVSGRARFDNQGRARLEGRTAGLSKLHADAASGRLVGAMLFGPDMEHLAHALAWSIQQGVTAQGLLSMPFYHPTVEEGLKDALRQICEAVSAPRPRERDDGFLPGG